MKLFKLYNEQTEAAAQRCGKPTRETSAAEPPFQKRRNRETFNFIKKETRHRSSPVNPAKPPGAPTSTEHLRWLLPNS